MKIAAFADIHINPRRVLESRWAHNTAHILVAAKRRALYRAKKGPRRGR